MPPRLDRELELQLEEATLPRSALHSLNSGSPTQQVVLTRARHYLLPSLTLQSLQVLEESPTRRRCHIQTTIIH